MSHLNNTKQSFEINHLWVQAITGMSAELLAQLQYERGVEYLRHYLQLDDATATAFEKSPRWWAWWQNQWSLRDAHIFLPGAMLTQECIAELYLRVHSARFIDAHPSCELMHKSYHEMSKQLYAELKRP